ncbi:hypothetical protein LIER_22079 [Lithospermum erythrorhizon]|uniref:Uncharacterized protein n=1 Tax=Lithospermum erythrorhizon TaxID=34254 RepID=A0AAV3QVM3_LITER
MLAQYPSNKRLSKTSRGRSGKFWFALLWSFSTAGQPWISFKKWWKSTYAQLKEQEQLGIIDYMVSAMWFLWKERNNIIFQDKRGTFEHIWEAGVRLVDDNASAHSRPVILHEEETDGPSEAAHRWEEAELGLMKVNVDAAFWQQQIQLRWEQLGAMIKESLWAHPLLEYHKFNLLF